MTGTDPVLEDVVLKFTSGDVGLGMLAGITTYDGDPKS
jgi:hypothetical protein